MDETLERYRESLDRLRGWGVSVSPNSRLQSYEKRWGALLDGTQGPLALPVGESLQLDFDYREMDEIITIVESYQAVPGPTDLERLRWLPKGSEHPDRDRDATAKAREAQYELYLRSLACQIDPKTAMGTPDLFLPGLGIAIEAKRPGRVARVDDRLRDGARRLAKSGLRGLIALSLDDLGRMAGRWLTVPSRDDIPDFANGKLVGLHEDIVEDIRRRCAKPEVLGVWLTLRLPIRETNTGMIHVHLQQSIQPTSTDPAEVAEVLRLHQRILSVNS